MMLRRRGYPFDSKLKSREARMHANHHGFSRRWNLVALLVLAGAPLGCRSPLSRDGVVRIESRPNSSEFDADAPKQRLASQNHVEELVSRVGENSSGPNGSKLASDSGSIRNKNSATSSVPARTASRRTAAPDVTRTVGVARDSVVADQQDNRPPKTRSPYDSVASSISNSDATGPIEMTLGDNSMNDLAKELIANSEPPEDAKAVQPPSRQPSRDDLVRELQSLSHTQRSEMVDAFGSGSPDVQRAALDRLVTMASKDAKRTSQPASIDALLDHAVTGLADLPPSAEIDSGVYATRLAGNDTMDDMRRRVAEARETGRWGNSGEAEGVRVADASAAENAQTTGETIQQVSASREMSDGPMVDRANHAYGDPNLDESRNDQREATAVESAMAKVSSALLSDDALYRMLLERLNSPAPGESKADQQRREIMARHLMVLSGDPDAAVAKIQGLTEKEQEYLRHQLLSLWTIIDPEGHPVPGRRFSAALPQLREAAKYLSAATDSLDVNALSFCTEIESYGQIKEFETSDFEAGQQVILYCEVDNFTVSRLAEGYETHLQGSYDIYDEQNNKVVSQLLPADKQVSRNYLRDYFIAYQMYLPKKLGVGNYQLQLTMEDVNGKKYGQSKVGFVIK